MRFLPDGTKDTTFLVNLANGACISQTGWVLANDKAYVTAAYTDAQSEIQIYLVRLNTDGSEDQSFAEVRPDRAILTMEVQDSGNVLIGGTFGLVNGQVRAAVARVLSDGTLDLSFDTGLPEDWRGSAFIHTLITQPDGKILIGGQFDTWGSVATANAIVRLNADGTLDPTFSATSTPNFGPVRDIELLPSGRSLIAHQDGVAMLEADGSLVPGFQVQITGASGAGLKDIEIQDDGKLILTGDIIEVGGVAKNSVARVNADGSLDASFDTGIGAIGSTQGTIAVPRVSRETRDGAILVGGSWTGFGLSGKIGGVVRLQGSLRTNWGEGEGGDKIIELPIVDDLTYEGDEQLNLQIAFVGGTGVEIGTSDSTIYTIVDNDPYLDMPIGAKTATSNQAFSVDVSGNFFHPEGGVLTFSANGLPASFTISADGVITGTPSSSDQAASPYTVTITAMDAAGAAANDQFQLSIVAAPVAPAQSSGGGAMGIFFVLLLLSVSGIKAISRG